MTGTGWGHPLTMLAPLVMLAPTRGRPGAAAQLIEAYEATMSSPGSSSLVLAVDDDDPELPGYLALDWPWTLVGPRLRLGGTLNAVAPRIAATPGVFAVGFLGDDHRPRTPGWDQLLLDELAALGSGVVYGDDGFQHERIPTAVAITADLIGELGWMVPPGMIHLLLDDWWKTLGAELDRLTYLPEVLIEHMHPAAGKGVWDERYAEVNSAHRWSADFVALDAYLVHEWPATRARLRDRLNAAARA